MLYFTQEVILQFSTMQNAVTGWKRWGLCQSHPSISQSTHFVLADFTFPFSLFNKHDPALARSFITLQWQQRQHGSLHMAAWHMTFSFLDINYCPKPTCFLFPPKTEVIKRCFRLACKQWIGTVLKYRLGDSLFRNGAESILLPRRNLVEVWGTGEGHTLLLLLHLI